MKNMEQDEVLHHLNDENSLKKLETLKQLQLTVKRNGGHLPWDDPWTIFKGLDGALLDTAWEVRLKCLHLIIDLIPQFGANLDSCMFLILKNLIPALGDHKLPVRRSSIQAMHLYLTHTKRFEKLSNAIKLYGLENVSESIQRDCVLALPIILTKDFSDRNFFPLVQCLAKKICKGYNETVQKPAFLALKKLCELVGSTEFNNYLQQLPEDVRKAYLRELNPEAKELYSDLNDSMEFPTIQTNFQKIGGLSGYHQCHEYQHHTHHHNLGYNEGLSDVHMSGDLEFGVFPQQLIVQINRVEDGYKLRAPAVENLRTTLSSLSKHEISYNMGSHMLSFIDFLDSLLDDANFKITTTALEILGIFVEKLQEDVQRFLKPLVLILARRLSNNKIVIRQRLMSVTMKLMENTSPKLVLSVMLENLRHKASRVRQEMINVVIAALLLFPSEEFDLCSLCREIVPLLNDPKRNVRRAALECVAVIAHAMGQGRYQPLIQVVNHTEINEKSEKGLMAAVQARLGRRHLPRLDKDGLVEYALSVPSSATQRKISGCSQNADIEWIGAVSGRSSSARYESVEDSTSINESIMHASLSDDRQRRFLSAGKGKNKLPWDGDEDDIQHNRVYDDLPGSAPTQKVASNKPSPLPLTATDTEKFKPKKSGFLVGPKDEENDTGSYKQIYRNDKLKREHAYPTLSNTDAKDSKENSTALWSTNKNQEDGKPMRSKLFPLSSKELDNSPIQMKPALARGSASGRSGSSSSSSSSRSETLYIAPSDSVDSFSYIPFANYNDEMCISLKNIRDSASKRRAEKLEKSSFVGGDSVRSSAQSVLSSDSGHYSISTFPDKEDETAKRKEVFPNKTPAESPFGNKPNLVRSNSLRNKRLPDLTYDTKKVNQWTEFSSGTFQNQTSDVCVFGKGYLEDAPVDAKPASNKIKHQKRNSKDISAGTPLGTASLYGHGSAEMRSGDSAPPGQDMIGVIGKGLNPSDTNSTNQNTSSPTECFNIKTDIGDMSDGIHGLGLSNYFKDKQNPSENNANSNAIDDDFMPISKTMRERMSVRRRKGDKQKPMDNKLPLEVLLATTNCPATEKPGKPPIGPKIKPKLHPDNGQLTGNSASDLNNNPESLASIPTGGLEELQRKLIQDDWKIKCEVLHLIRQLAKFHPNIFDSGLHPLLLAVTKELNNLRSQVKRDAILCVTDMFLYLKKRMDHDLDQTIDSLLALMAVSQEFIRNDVEKAFNVMIDNVTCSKALPILITKGLKHRSVGIRKTASYYVLAIAKKIGHRRLLSGAKDLTDKILQATLDCLRDASKEVRIHGKEILYLLLENPNLDQLLEKYLPSESVATVRTHMEVLSKKGLMEMSYDSSVPHSAKSLPSSRGGSAGSLLSAQISPKRPVSFKNIESIQEEIKKMGNLLSANDWRTRQKGLEAFKEMCEIRPEIVMTNITQVFDKFLPRLNDANSKVNLLALKSLHEVIPILHNSMSPVVNLTVNSVASNLSSKNIEIHSTAIKIIDSLVKCIEPSVLLRPFVNQVTSNARRCPEIIPKITEFVEREYRLKPKQIEMHILPMLVHLLNCVNGSGTVQGGSSSIRQATTNLICALNQQMGPLLMEKFSQMVDVKPRHQQYLQDIMNQT